MKIADLDTPPSKRKKRVIKKENIEAFLMVLIPLIGFFVLSVYPILWTFRWSFFSYNGIPSRTVFVGLQNFKTMFTTDFTYWKTWLFTLQFMLVKLPMEIPFAMFLAVLLSRKQTKGSGFFRSAFYLPTVISVVVVGLMITSMFRFDGLINTFLINAGIITRKIDWFATKQSAIIMLAVGGTWVSFGVNVMYFMAALCNVPEDIYESARIDGASKPTQFFKITLPMITPVFSTIMLLSIIGTLSVNEYIIVVTGGAPSGQTQTVMSYLTQKFVPGFAESSTPPLGYGCAMSMVTTVLFGFIAIAYKKFDKKINSIF